MKLKIILLIVTLLTVRTVDAQDQDTKQLKVEDTMPDLTLTPVMNYKSNTLKISDFKGKLLLLDLWGTTCSSCIAAFAKLHDYQKTYDNSVQIVLVNPAKMKDDDLKITNAIQKWEKRSGRRLTLPNVKYDSLIEKYFFFDSLPLTIWIDASGKIKAVTNGQEVTDVNIEKALKGDWMQFKQREDLTEFNTTVPLYVNGNGGVPTQLPIFRSMFTTEIPYAQSVRISGVVKNRAIYREVLPLANMYREFSGIQFVGYADNQWIWKTADTSNKSLLKDFDKTLCYEIICPLGMSEDKLKNFALQDLERTFGLKLHNEKRTMKVFVLKPVKTLKKITSSVQTLEKEYRIGKNYQNNLIKNGDVNDVVNALSRLYPMPVINETGFTKKIDLDFPSDIASYDIAKMKSWLESLSFVVAIEDREVPVVIVEEVQY